MIRMITMFAEGASHAQIVSLGELLKMCSLIINFIKAKTPNCDQSFLLLQISVLFQSGNFCLDLKKMMIRVNH